MFVVKMYDILRMGGRQKLQKFKGPDRGKVSIIKNLRKFTTKTRATENLYSQKEPPVGRKNALFDIKSIKWTSSQIIGPKI